jgi:hypothetical protein
MDIVSSKKGNDNNGLLTGVLNEKNDYTDSCTAHSDVRIFTGDGDRAVWT